MEGSGSGLEVSRKLTSEKEVKKEVELTFPVLSSSD